MDVISIVLTVVGVLGAGGALALFLLAPALFAVIVTRAESALGAILATRLGCAVLAGLIAFIVADQARSFRDGARCSTAIAELVAQAKAAGVERDATVRRAVANEYAPVIAGLTSENEDLKQRAAKYDQDRLAAMAAGATGGSSQEDGRKRSFAGKDGRERPDAGKDGRERPFAGKDGPERPDVCLLRPDALQLRQRTKKLSPAIKR